jgi:glycosyltransferase involved in cell wall biosynthesis
MLKVGIVCDLKEEQWPSMDLIGDMLLEQFADGYRGELEASRMQPKLLRSCTALPLTRNSQLAWNADRLLNRAVFYPWWLRKRSRSFDVVHIVDHSYAQLAWQTVPSRTIVTCHDLEAFSCLLDEPTQRRPKWFQAYSRHILKGMQRAAHVVCVSETVKNALVANRLLDSKKVSVVHNGVHPSCQPEPRPEFDAHAERLLPFSANTPLLLHVGSTVRRKRIDLLLRIFASVRRQIPNVRLVRVGGRLSAEQTAEAKELGVLDGIAQLPFLSRDVLAAVNRRCAAVLLPSETEGFGLPVVEAMACGCPVIATDSAVLREVGGEAAIFAPLEDIAMWSSRTVALLTEKIEDPRTCAMRRGLCIANAKRFSWATAASQLAQLYTQIANQ